ncbi:MFS general substrate transporter [Podospora appendiculata]|uniref:MFS general substrate transporter n=1 Tax=Podospora appendiculata TaxID=314037 RepID=A0AAE1CA79_9PEZI|nr:MFS general substrate transporter [Podospora appendiculata]
MTSAYQVQGLTMMSTKPPTTNSVYAKIKQFLFSRGHSSPSNNGDKGGEVPRWSFGVLNPRDTARVAGSILLLPDLGVPTELPAPSTPPSTSSHPDSSTRDRKTTSDGSIILDPQPDDSPNDPLNWPQWRRDAALATMGIYCMVGGGQTPLLAAGFTDVAADYGVRVSRVALTTGLFMLGLGVGCVVVSPAAIVYGKRPVYLLSIVLFMAASVWCAVSPDFASLLVARVVQGMAVSPAEALPSATIAEIFFLHERAFRIGVYGLMLLGGKNLVPLVSAAIIERLGWHWVFWVVVMVVALCGILMFFFMPETFWDRTPSQSGLAVSSGMTVSGSEFLAVENTKKNNSEASTTQSPAPQPTADESPPQGLNNNTALQDPNPPELASSSTANITGAIQTPPADIQPKDTLLELVHITPILADPTTDPLPPKPTTTNTGDPEKASPDPPQRHHPPNPYTSHKKTLPATRFTAHLRPHNGRLRPHTPLLHAALRPLILLLLYPSILYSSAIYASSIGWLVVISESVALIYRDPATSGYRFGALATGLVYLSPFVGGVLGTVVAGRVSDLLVRAMARRNGGVYEPEFRLVMVVPVAVATAAGLMGFGWSAGVGDAWIVPTVLFGVVSFGCSLGSTTAISFCIDSYGQFAGEALVTLNFSKNIFHGLVFSLFVTGWVESDGPKTVFVWIGIIQLILLSFTIPMFLFGKRARHWTAKRKFCHSIMTGA